MPRKRKLKKDAIERARKMQVVIRASEKEGKRIDPTTSSQKTIDMETWSESNKSAGPSVHAQMIMKEDYSNGIIV
ncbi:unnamed protein product, partial [Brenthis ino]